LGREGALAPYPPDCAPGPDIPDPPEIFDAGINSQAGSQVESRKLGNKTAAAPVLQVMAGIGPASYFLFIGDRNAAIH
jgi:hypothetical protein